MTPRRLLAAALAAGAVALPPACSPDRPPDYFEPPASSVVEAPAAGGTSSKPLPPPEPPRETRPRPVPEVATLPSFAGLFERLSPSVVNVYTQEVVRERLVDPLSGRPESDEGTSLGSGFLVDAEGHILTNAHVVENAAEIRVRFHDDLETPARLVGIDPVRDLALLQVDGAAGLVPAVPGDSDTLRVGDWVLAIGNPLGLHHTLTKGIVSAKGRSELLSETEGYPDLLQVDAPINRGSSGGPLFDLEGRVVGVTTVVAAEGQGIGFAIPWNAVAEALPRLREGGQVSRSWLGVFVRPAPSPERGVLVEGVVDESPAARAGLRPGDLLTAFAGRTIPGVAAFRLLVSAGVAGRPTSLQVLRGPSRLEVEVVLEEARGP